jgi:hypothetical protein
MADPHHLGGLTLRHIKRMLEVEVFRLDRLRWGGRRLRNSLDSFIRIPRADPGRPLRNPRRAELKRELEVAAKRANERAKVRLAGALAAGPILAHPYGVMEANGGLLMGMGRPNWRATSVVGAAWTTARGAKHVRVWGMRRLACGFPDPFLFLPEESDRQGLHACWALTFPERFTRLRHVRARRLQRILDRIGPPGWDDRLNLALHVARVRAHVPRVGAILSDDLARPQVVQVVVRDPSTGLRHHISVPPRFGDPQSKTFQKLGNSVARIQAALAWTFDFKPEEYAPALEA